MLTAVLNPNLQLILLGSSALCSPFKHCRWSQVAVSFLPSPFSHSLVEVSGMEAFYQTPPQCLHQWYFLSFKYNPLKSHLNTSLLLPNSLLCSLVSRRILSDLACPPLRIMLHVQETKYPWQHIQKSSCPCLSTPAFGMKQWGHCGAPCQEKKGRKVLRASLPGKALLP